jgi:hypothetical protein
MEEIIGETIGFIIILAYRAIIVCAAIKYLST